MVPKRAFSVVAVSSVGNELWLVQGRAYEMVRVGDILSSLPQPANEPAMQFKVVSLSTYDRQVDALTPMLTGNMTLAGPNAAILKDTPWLVFP
jgi:hypothetical protein